MKHVTCLLITVLMLAGISLAEPNISVTDVSDSDYAQWLVEKNELWTAELERMKPFAPTQVEPLQEKIAQIERHALELREQPDSVVSEQLKAETHLLVYSLERDLEGLYVDLERASGPVVVLNL